MAAQHGWSLNGDPHSTLPIPEQICPPRTPYLQAMSVELCQKCSAMLHNVNILLQSALLPQCFATVATYCDPQYRNVVAITLLPSIVTPAFACYRSTNYSAVPVNLRTCIIIIIFFFFSNHAKLMISITTQFRQ